MSHFDFATCPYKIMNILRGAIKPQFRKTIMNFVDWHSLILLVITETIISRAKATKIIESLPFDGATITNTIGFASGIWMLWRSNLVQVDVLATTE